MSLGILEDNPALGLFFGKGEGPPTNTPSPPPTGDPQPTPANVDIGDVTVKALTMNVQNTPDLSRANVRKCGVAVSGRFGYGGIQELGEAGADRRDVLSGLGNAYAMTAHGNVNVQTQIAYLQGRSQLGKGGYVQCVPGGQPYPNPERGFVFQEFIPEHGPQFLFVVTHMVNKAWNTVPDEHKALRKQNWNKHYTEMRGWLTLHAQAMPIVLTGDFNRISFPMPMPNARVMAGSGSIDKIIVSLPQGFRLKGGQSFTIATPSDHDARGREFTLERKRPS